MPFNPDLKQGQILNNDELRRIFRCGLQGGMRRSLSTNSLVIVSDYTRTIYVDRWIEDVFHYTGMGLTGDQRLTAAQNRTLSESHENGVDVFLFEVMERGRYLYQGIVRLAAEPYQEEQPDNNGQSRNVWIFPLKLIDEGHPALISEDSLIKIQKERERKAYQLSETELKKRAESAPKKSGTRYTVVKQYDRNENVILYVKNKANNICDLCKLPAPFRDRNRRPYLEVHHIEWLSRGGADSIVNAAALCPNCHRKMHILDLIEDRTLLKDVAWQRGASI